MTLYIKMKSLLQVEVEIKLRRQSSLFARLEQPGILQCLTMAISTSKPVVYVTYSTINSTVYVCTMATHLGNIS